MLFKEISVMGSVMGTHRELEECLRLVSEGKLRAVIDQVYPLSQVRDAVAHLLERRVFGKVMVIPDSQYPPTEPYSTLD
jgi:D-arabinose 1-dehydrogenase-like Zn-dependent alcohol dehydrogenase